MVIAGAPGGGMDGSDVLVIVCRARLLVAISFRDALEVAEKSLRRPPFRGDGCGGGK